MDDLLWAFDLLDATTRPRPPDWCNCQAIPGTRNYSWPDAVALITDEASDQALDAAEQWALALSPAVAEPLVAWLRESATRFEALAVHTHDEALATAFARAVLGGQP